MKIKLRAWDKKNKKMYDNIKLEDICGYWYDSSKHGDNDSEGSVVWYIHQLIVDRSGASDKYVDIGVSDKFRKNLKWMLFTGCRDKNNIEIYEGDIVKPGYCQEVAEVIKHNGMFLTKSPNQSIKDIHDTYEECMTFLIPIRTCKMEVVGNIYENSELIV